MAVKLHDSRASVGIDIDVALSSRESDLHQAAGFETALRAYVGHCVDVDGRSCFLGSTVEKGLHTISALLDSIAKKPLPTQSGEKLTAGNAFFGVVALACGTLIALGFERLRTHRKASRGTGDRRSDGSGDRSAGQAEPAPA